MNFVLLTGPQAVGKMTVGEHLSAKTGYKLFHNHMTIDLLLKVFSTWDDMHHLNVLFREEIFRTFAKLKTESGLIFTYVMDYDSEHEWQYIEHLKDIFKDHSFYFVELVADLETRLTRNKTENRLSKKWTKQNLEESEERLKKTMELHRTTSHIGEVKYKNYLRIDNTELSAENTAKAIIDFFHFYKKGNQL